MNLYGIHGTYYKLLLCGIQCKAQLHIVCGIQLKLQLILVVSSLNHSYRGIQIKPQLRGIPFKVAVNQFQLQLQYVHGIQIKPQLCGIPTKVAGNQSKPQLQYSICMVFRLNRSCVVSIKLAGNQFKLQLHGVHCNLQLSCV
jgi:hypothetical protein